MYGTGRQAQTMKNGTTTACYFATIHTSGSVVLADVVGWWRFGKGGMALYHFF